MSLYGRPSGKAKDPRGARGAAGEEAASQYLRRQGYDIIARNWRCRYGEIDVIAQHADTIVFVEVRSRTARTMHAFGAPLESITAKKQMTVRRCAQAYLQRSGQPAGRIRFDCVGVVLDNAGTAVDLSHIVDAF